MKGSSGDFEANLDAFVKSLWKSSSLISESWPSLFIKTEPFLINTKQCVHIESLPEVLVCTNMIKMLVAKRTRL